MRRSTLTILLSGCLLGSTQIHADEALLSAIQTTNVPLSSQLEQQLLAAEGDAIPDAVAAVVASVGGDESAVESIVFAAITAAPDHVDGIVSAANHAAPKSLAAIQRGAVAASGTPSYFGRAFGRAIATERAGFGIPRGSTGGGGASPN